MTFIDKFDAPFGELRIVSRDNCITNIDIKKAEVSTGDPPLCVRECKLQLEKYFKGELKEFTFKISPEGTDFQKRVWSGLQAIPWGKTETYSELAQNIGCPQGYRAAANACGKNPILIVIPCHRCLAKDGLGGFSCGIEKKKYLLALESSNKK
ncbi:methylated-DNA--protein-cysteine methyltransferase containing protein [Trichomonas vaginalis G3]|uniref:Methylated-DNA--protein-cysteine methyltransferase n=1 Tax=Trichomonas vaginalis (strain ATCC PRA-98 / G3) TaxID=412133 RepID=A2EGA1_TRIV3|nr:methylated-DNA-[protein]-cysteine S-methyltransferase protein [Trichomonas vaginalis G3]EAY08280.1 methylated-DNA--protein-cysteine methyltransferase containing protein [Trichomonas vaginalis G3]KAI5546125.1 methylated-DNA-[protein]-cysteine S-methyltransferase protein [Trichomonas vaginalis G3]|eukprot:XP_001320503.1 methylated-DNA--protein-cysteine methyltransferase containing protein [Trichomonas vaginalis G3]